MGRPHLLSFFDTFEAREQGGVPRVARLIGYEPPQDLDDALRVAAPILASRERRLAAMPDDETLRRASGDELEQWANHLLSGGALPPPGAKHDRAGMERGAEARAASEWRRQYHQARSLVDAMTRAQGEFMITGDWLARRRLTVPMAARAVGIPERTAHRIIECAKLQFNGATFAVRLLLCRDSVAEVARALLPLARAHPGWGAPRLARELARRGVHASERMAGKALYELRMRMLL